MHIPAINTPHVERRKEIAIQLMSPQCYIPAMAQGDKLGRAVNSFSESDIVIVGRAVLRQRGRFTRGLLIGPY